MRTSPFHFLFAAALALLLTACRNEAPRQQLVPSGAAVLAFGDSVTFGTGAGTGEDYPAALATRSGWKIVNAGIPGDTAAAARTRIEPLLAEHKPALVIVELGGNDFLRRRPEAEVKEDLRAIVKAVKAAGAVPVLVSVPEFSLGLLGLSDSAIYATLAKEEKIWLVKEVFAKVLSDEALRADRIHPNAQGYRALADGIAQSLATAGLLAGPSR